MASRSLRVQATSAAADHSRVEGNLVIKVYLSDGVHLVRPRVLTTRAIGRALSDWAHGVVGEFVDALNTTFAGVTDAVTLAPNRTLR